jgi:UDP-GlcNAc:undecaprenyl-phosphate GlcNAc-1-phosphate transferase
MRVRVGSTTMLQRIGAVMRAIGGGAGWKSVAGAMADLLVVGAAFVAAYHLRFDSVPPAAHWNVMMQALPAVIALKVGVFYVFRLYHGIWRHAGTPEMVRLVGASTVASGLTCVGLVAVFGPERLSTSVLILDWLLSTIAVGSVRFGFRGLRQYFASHRSVGRRVLIVGTGPESVLVLRYLRQSDDLHRTAVGFIDEDRQKGLRLQGLLVLGGPDDLPSLLQSHDVDEVILPDGDDFSDDLRQVVRRACHQAGVPCQHFSLELRPSPAPHFDFSSGDGASSDRASSERPSNGTPSNNPPNASPGSSPDSSASSSPSRSSDSDSPEEIGR